MTWRWLGWTLALSGALLAACGDDDGSDGTGEPDAGDGVDSGGSTFDGGGGTIEEDAGPIGDVTYYGDVRPILARHCVSCHVAGGVGPFPLDTYEGTRVLATRIAEVTRDRIMPPFLADNSGECHTFRDARWLTNREIATLAAWDEQGEPEGDPATPAPEVPSLPTLDGAITTIRTDVYAPNSARTDDYRCFVVDGPTATTFLTGYEVHPGNAPIVHHVIVYAPTNAAAADQARSLDANEAGPGYTCFGAANVSAFPVVLWAPGAGATRFPNGTGVQLEGGLPLIIQVHYNLLAGSDPDQTRVDLQTAASATRARIIPLGDYDMSLAPRQASVSTTHTEDLSRLARGLNVPITVYGMFPHMHTLGRQLQVEHVPTSGAEQCLVDVPRWDFNWQLAYFYETPITISSLDSLRITCTYDTTSREERVTWGEGTQDEMCLNFFYAVLAGGL